MTCVHWERNRTLGWRPNTLLKIFLMVTTLLNKRFSILFSFISKMLNLKTVLDRPQDDEAFLSSATESFLYIVFAISNVFDYIHSKFQ